MRLETLSLHAGYSAGPASRAVAVPIYQTAAYAFDDSAHAAALFDLASDGCTYTRVTNPTTEVLEKRVAALEGGAAGLALASGAAAVTCAILTIAAAGDNIVAARSLYGGTHSLFADLLPAWGIEARFVDSDDPAQVAAVADDRTKAVFCESIGNPLGDVVDLGRFAAAAHDAGVPLIVDNTVPSPALCRPLEHGADIVVHSLTKYLGGHGTSIGGLIVDGGSFDWSAQPGRFPSLAAPEPSYHGLVFAEAFPDAPFVSRARAVVLRATGAAISPTNSFHILQGVETLALRLDRISENALAVADHLADHPAVSWVSYAGQPTHPDHELVRAYHGGRASGLLSFGIEGGYESAIKFVESLELVLHVVNIGDAKSLACHPASTTHRQLSPEGLAAAGISPDLVRLSLGIEHVDDILDDLDRALAAAVA